MDSKELKNALFIPLHLLIYVDEIDDFYGCEGWRMKALKMEHTTDEIKRIYNALKWVKNNSDYDFKSILPELGHSNNSIYNFLCKLEMKYREDFEF